MKKLNLTVITGLVALLTMSTACEVTYDSEPAATVQPTGEAAASPAPTGTPHTGGNSSLGGAKRAAENTVGDLERRQQEIANQIGDD